jgi:hypothetical protein
MKYAIPLLMKKPLLLLSLICVSLGGIAQISYEENKVDPFNGTITKSTRFSEFPFVREKFLNTFAVKEIGASIRVEKEDNYYKIIIYFPASFECAYRGSTCKIKFTDGTIVDCPQYSDTRCNDVYSNDNKFYIRYDIATNEEYVDDRLILPSPEIVKGRLKKLTSVPVERFRIYSSYASNNFEDFVPNPEFTAFPPKEVFMRHFRFIQ